MYRRRYIIPKTNPSILPPHSQPTAYCAHATQPTVPSAKRPQSAPAVCRRSAREGGSGAALWAAHPHTRVGGVGSDGPRPVSWLAGFGRNGDALRRPRRMRASRLPRRRRDGRSGTDRRSTAHPRGGLATLQRHELVPGARAGRGSSCRWELVPGALPAGHPSGPCGMLLWLVPLAARATRKCRLCSP